MYQLLDVPLDTYVYKHVLTVSVALELCTTNLKYLKAGIILFHLLSLC